MAAQWYIVHAYSNFEKRVAESIRSEAEAKGLSAKIEEVLVPTENITEVRRGRKVNKEKRYFPGYIMVKMEMDEASYHLIKSIPKVTGFLGSGTKPHPVTAQEVDRILGQIEEDIEQEGSLEHYEIGETVRVKDGNFQSFEGVVEEVDEVAARLKVAISIFGRATPVELYYSQVEKIEI